MATIIDCSVQKISRFAGSFRDSKIFFSKKHNIYCVKKEYTHLPNGKVCAVSDYFNEAKHDFAIFLERLELHKNMLQKNNGTGFWSIMADKGYQGGEGYINMIIPKKGNDLSQADERRNRNIGRVRIICENFYGRMKKLWGAAREKVRGDLSNYDNLNLICVALTNYHIDLNPLRNNDGTFLRNLNARDFTRIIRRTESGVEEPNNSLATNGSNN